MFPEGPCEVARSAEEVVDAERAGSGSAQVDSLAVLVTAAVVPMVDDHSARAAELEGWVQADSSAVLVPAD